MNRTREARCGAATTIRNRSAAVCRQSERTIMLSTVLLGSAVSAAVGYLLAQCFSVDVLSSLAYMPEDCWLDWSAKVGRHCFSDYAMVADVAVQPNPWNSSMILLFGNDQPSRIGYPASGLLPQLTFGVLGKMLGSPQLGLISYLFILTIAVLTPAVWAARGARGLERVVIFVALGAAAIPVWAVIDRGNSAGFVVPVALVFLVALRQERWRLAVVMVVLAALVKPQFAVLAVALLAARQWRLGLVAIVGVVTSNLAAYLVWPQDFPKTVVQSVRNLLETNGSFAALIDMRNVSFGRALLLIPDNVEILQTGNIPAGFLATPRSVIGYAVLVVVLIAMLVLGRRIPPVMAGIVLLATASLFPPLTSFYYLVFVLPVAALVVRDPDGPPGAGVFDKLAIHGCRRRLVTICISLAAALSIAQIAIPTPPFPAPIFGQMGAKGIIGTTPIVLTTAIFTPILWLVACAVTIVSYVLRPSKLSAGNQGSAREDPQNAVASASSASEVMTGRAPRASE